MMNNNNQACRNKESSKSKLWQKWPKEDETLMSRVRNSNGQSGSYNRPNKEGNCNNVAQNREN